MSSNYTNRQVDQVPHTEALASFPQPRAVGRRETAEQATYTYNAFGQRIGFKDSGTQTWTVYNGSSADANPYADFSSSGSVTMGAISTHGPSIRSWHGRVRAEPQLGTSRTSSARWRTSCPPQAQCWTTSPTIASATS